MEPCDWLLANEEVSRLSGDCGGVIRLGLLHSEWEREPGFGEKNGVAELTASSSDCHRYSELSAVCMLLVASNSEPLFND